MDITGLGTFEEIIELYKKHGAKVYLCEANGHVKRKLAKAKVLRLVEGEKTFISLADAIEASK